MKLATLFGLSMVVANNPEYGISAPVTACEGKVRVRPSIYDMKHGEWERFVSAVKKLNYGTRPTLWDNFAKLHTDIYPAIHGKASFLAWHRAFLFAMERSLQKIDSNVMLPYWDWSYHSQKPESDPVISPSRFGADSKGRPDGCISNGDFSEMEVYYDGTETEPKEHCIKRDFRRQSNAVEAWLGPDLINHAILKAPTFKEFWINLETGPHGVIHNTIGADFSGHASPPTRCSTIKAGRESEYFTDHSISFDEPLVGLNYNLTHLLDIEKFLCYTYPEDHFERKADGQVMHFKPTATGVDNSTSHDSDKLVGTDLPKVEESNLKQAETNGDESDSVISQPEGSELPANLTESGSVDSDTLKLDKPSESAVESELPTKSAVKSELPTKSAVESGLPTKSAVKSGLPTKSAVESGLPTESGDASDSKAPDSEESEPSTKPADQSGLSAESTDQREPSADKSKPSTSSEVESKADSAPGSEENTHPESDKASSIKGSDSTKPNNEADFEPEFKDEASTVEQSPSPSKDEPLATQETPSPTIPENSSPSDLEDKLISDQSNESGDEQSSDSKLVQDAGNLLKLDSGTGDPTKATHDNALNRAFSHESLKPNSAKFKEDIKDYLNAIKNKTKGAVEANHKFQRRGGYPVQPIPAPPVMSIIPASLPYAEVECDSFVEREKYDLEYVMAGVQAPPATDRSELHQIRVPIPQPVPFLQNMGYSVPLVRSVERKFALVTDQLNRDPNFVSTAALINRHRFPKLPPSQPRRNTRQCHRRDVRFHLKA
ncbi:hypothetical protein L0F63_006791 [Massospora cicadina]|nr:hypothetical protein L0F63_006791 [Massospora cicadina]